MDSHRQEHKLVRRNVVARVRSARTSVSLERVVWQAFREIAAQQGKTVHQLVMAIDRTRTLNRSAAIRVYIIEYYRADSSTRGNDAL
jgi:predicted DNA-binding ribbon-helix-helix protein